MIDRRSLLAGAAALLAARPAFAQEAAPLAVDLGRITLPRPPAPPARKLDLLVLGGTVFVGPAFVKAALARGHRVTLFNRGRSNPGLFPQCEKLRGDRTEGPAGYAALGTRRFDAVVDTWDKASLRVDEAARLLADRAERYLYVSSISTYDFAAWRASDRIAEDSPRTPIPADFAPANPEARYGQRKRAAEDAVHAAFGDRALSVRPHQVLGYHVARTAASQRYWPMRFVRGGAILVPGDGQDRVQFIDVGDLAGFMLHLLETGQRGPFNTMRTLRWADFANELSALAPAPPQLHWMAHDRIAAAGLRPASDFPQWVPRQNGPGFMGHDPARADAAGLSHRPSSLLWQDLVAGTAHAFPEGFAFQTFPGEAPISLAREAELIAAL
jgi:2'-hydroxyisoflavone reductase